MMFPFLFTIIELPWHSESRPKVDRIFSATMRTSIGSVANWNRYFDSRRSKLRAHSSSKSYFVRTSCGYFTVKRKTDEFCGLCEYYSEKISDSEIWRILFRAFISEPITFSFIYGRRHDSLMFVSHDIVQPIIAGRRHVTSLTTLSLHIGRVVVGIPSIFSLIQTNFPAMTAIDS